jgi:hypothetical protein
MRLVVRVTQSPWIICLRRSNISRAMAELPQISLVRPALRSVIPLLNNSLAFGTYSIFSQKLYKGCPTALEAQEEQHINTIHRFFHTLLYVLIESPYTLFAYVESKDWGQLASAGSHCNQIDGHFVAIPYSIF